MSTQTGRVGGRVVARGLSASPGVATGHIVFSTSEAQRLTAEGRSVVFVRTETSAEDIEGMKIASGILTTRGGLTSDAAIVARSLGKPCVAGCSAIAVDYGNRTLTVAIDDGVHFIRKQVVLRAEQPITVDGSTGDVSIPADGGAAVGTD